MLNSAKIYDSGEVLGAMVDVSTELWDPSWLFRNQRKSFHFGRGNAFAANSHTDFQVFICETSQTEAIMRFALRIDVTRDLTSGLVLLVYY